MDLGLGFTFSKSTGSAFSEGPGLGPGLVDKVCHFKATFRDLNMLMRAYNLITKKITRSLYMMLEKPNKDNKYLAKY